MTPGEKCSLLLMRDDGRTMRHRMSLRLLCALCVFIALLPPLLGAACWLAFELHRENSAINLQLNQLEQENHNTVAELKRLSKLEHLLAMPDTASMQALNAQQAKNRMQEQEAAAQSENNTQADAAADKNTTTQPAQTADNVDLKLIGVENVHARLLAGNKLRIHLDLLNAQQKGQLVGRVVCLARNADGASEALDIPKDLASFRINRFKRAVFMPALPESMNKQPGLVVVVEILLDEQGLVYRNEFPVEK